MWTQRNHGLCENRTEGVVYRNINQFREMAKDIIGNTLEIIPASTRLEALRVVDKSLGSE